MRRRLPELILAASALVGVLSSLATALVAAAEQEHVRHGMRRLALLELRDALDEQLPQTLAVGLLVWIALRVVARVRRRGGAPAEPPRRGRRVGWLTVAAALGLLAAVHAVDAYDARRHRPDGPPVLLIVVDSLRADRLGCYGGDGGLTPSIDAFAAGADRYAAAYSTAPWTTPSVGSMLTGRYPSQLGVVDRAVALPAALPTLAEVLREHRYRTAAVVSHTLLSANLAFDQGFDCFDEGGIGERDGSTAAEVTRRGLAWLDRRGDAPYLLLLHYFDPHYDYVLHPIHDPLPDYDGPVHSGQTIFAQRELAPHLGPESVAYLRALYDSEVRHTDQQIGALLDGLRAAGRFDEALIVLAADHGEALIERGDPWIGHTRTVHQELIHVPLLIKWPGQTDGRTVERVVSLIDLAPTLVAAAGAALPPTYDGATGSLRADAPRDGSAMAFAETQKGADLCAVVLDDLKLIVDWRGGASRLYDLRADPGELHDVADERPVAAELLMDEARDWTARVRDGAPRAAPIEPRLTREQQRRLKELGYL